MFTECTSKILAKNIQKYRTEKPNTDKRWETQFWGVGERKECKIFFKLPLHFFNVAVYCKVSTLRCKHETR